MFTKNDHFVPLHILSKDGILVHETPFLMTSVGCNLPSECPTFSCPPIHMHTPKPYPLRVDVINGCPLTV